ncbi:MAG: porin family protein [Cytophagaceae bacterium]
MKKITLLLMSIACMTGYSNAQDTDYREKLLVGLKAGANFSNVYDTHGETFRADAKFGAAGGAFVAIPLGKYIGVQPEILLSQRGFKGSGELLGVPYKMHRTTTHLDIPLLLAFKPSEFITFLAGPQYSYLLNQKDKFSSSLGSSQSNQDFKADNVRRNMLCLTGGVDFTIRHLVLGLRAGMDMQNNNGDGSSTNPRYKNMWYQGTIGYRFL